MCRACGGLSGALFQHGKYGGRWGGKRRRQKPAGGTGGAGRGGGKAQARRAKCRFGAGCYRRNPDHRRQFWHPGDADQGASSDGSDAAWGDDGDDGADASNILPAGARRGAARRPVSYAVDSSGSESED